MADRVEKGKREIETFEYLEKKGSLDEIKTNFQIF